MGVVSSGWGRFAAAHPARRRPRHRAATHVLLFAACLDAGAVDQAGVCLRQLCAPLSSSKKGPQMPAASADPAARRRRPSRRVRGERVDQTRLGVTRGGPDDGSKDAPGAARQGGRGGARRARRRGGTRARADAAAAAAARDASSSLEDGERAAAAHGAVVAEAAEAAAWMHASLVSCGACRGGAAAARVRFGEPELFGGGRLRDESASSERDDDARRRREPSSAGVLAVAASSRSAPSRRSSRRARPTSRRRAPRRGVNETLGAAPWRCGPLGAGSDARAARRPARRRALFARRRWSWRRARRRPGRAPRARATARGAPIGDVADGRRSEADDPTRIALRGARPAIIRTARPGCAAGWMRFPRAAPRARRAASGRVSVERRRAGVDAEARAYGGGAWGCAMACAARLPRAARVSHDELSPFSRATGRRQPAAGVGADVRAARHALASCAAATVRWLAELIARLPASRSRVRYPAGSRGSSRGGTRARRDGRRTRVRRDPPRGGLDRRDRRRRRLRLARRAGRGDAPPRRGPAGVCVRVDRRRRRQALRRRRRFPRRRPPRPPSSRRRPDAGISPPPPRDSSRGSSTTTTAAPSRISPRRSSSRTSPRRRRNFRRRAPPAPPRARAPGIVAATVRANMAHRHRAPRAARAGAPDPDPDGCEATSTSASAAVGRASRLSALAPS